MMQKKPDDRKKQVFVTINGKKCPAEEGEILLSVAIREKIDIPHLCYEASLDPWGACRLCMVEVVKSGRRETTTSCTRHAEEGLEVFTDTPEIIKHRTILFELYLAEAPGSDVIKEMAARYGVTKTRFLKKIDPDDPLGGRCVLCGLCVRACNEIMGAGAIGFINRGPYTVVSTPYFDATEDCLGCGACARVCPTDAIRITDQNDVRIMSSWNDTRVPMLQCSICGEYFAPIALSAIITAKIDPHLAEELQSLCPECRGKRIAKREFTAKSGGAARYV
jgi:bidirectional [NiFe] hydrogenase diaphorase subunit